MDPHSTAAGAITGAAAAMPAMLLGAQVDALVIGMMAALFVSIMTETIDNRIKAGAAVMFSSLSAGYGSPIAAQFIAANYPSLVVASTHDVLRLATALLIGAAMPGLVPVAMRFIQRKGNEL